MIPRVLHHCHLDTRDVNRRTTDFVSAVFVVRMMNTIHIVILIVVGIVIVAAETRLVLLMDGR